MCSASFGLLRTLGSRKSKSQAKSAPWQTISPFDRVQRYQNHGFMENQANKTNKNLRRHHLNCPTAHEGVRANLLLSLQTFQSTFNLISLAAKGSRIDDRKITWCASIACSGLVSALPQKAWDGFVALSFSPAPIDSILVNNTSELPSHIPHAPHTHTSCQRHQSANPGHLKICAKQAMPLLQLGTCFVAFLPLLSPDVPFLV